MQRNFFEILFISLFILGILAYTIRTGIKAWEAHRLNTQIYAESVEWSVIAKNEEAYTPFAQYSYLVKGKHYTGKTEWQKTYLNQWTAEEAIQRLKQKPLTVWFDSDAPSISSLQKSFPLKESLYTLILWILGIYFLILGYCAKRRLS